jgi:hypothetical protein
VTFITAADKNVASPARARLEDPDAHDLARPALSHD